MGVVKGVVDTHVGSMGVSLPNLSFINQFFYSIKSDPSGFFNCIRVLVYQIFLSQGALPTL